MQLASEIGKTQIRVKTLGHQQADSRVNDKEVVEIRQGYTVKGTLSQTNEQPVYRQEEKYGLRNLLKNHDIEEFKNIRFGLGLAAHACNPSPLGGQGR